MPEFNQLNTILNRIEAGKRLRARDLELLVEAIRSQKVTLATGDRSVAIGGSADGAVIMTGDLNLVLTGSTAKEIQQMLSSRSHNEDLVLEYVENEVTSRLSKSLHNAVLIHLGIEAQTGKIQHPWTSEIKVENEPKRDIPKAWRSWNIFDAAQGRLLILGKPGAGKTTTMLELTQELLARARNDANAPIPVVLPLSSWEISQLSIHEWLISELQSKYGVKQRFGRQLLADRRLILMLDGLDELKAVYQTDCIQAINRFLESDERPQYVVVSSRSEEYDINQTKLKLNTAICIKDLDNQQIEKYLTDINCRDLWTILNRDLELLMLIRQPFWLSIVVLASDGISVEYWNRASTSEARFTGLLNSYFKQMTSRKAGILATRSHAQSDKKEINNEYIKIWLSHLAQKMNMDSKVEFLIEEIHPGWLESDGQRSLYKAVSVLVFLMLSVLILHTSSFFLFVILGINHGWASILFLELAIWLSSSILSMIYYSKVNFYRKFSPVETMAWSGDKAFMSFRLEIAIALEECANYLSRKSLQSTYGNHYYYRRSVLSKVGWLLNLAVRKLIHIIHFLFILLSGIFSGFHEMLKSGIVAGKDLEEKLAPNQGIKKSQENYASIIAIWALIYVLILGLVGLILPPALQGLQQYTIPAGVLIGSLFGIYTGIERGGKACIQHIAIRIILWLVGKAPNNYAVFLDYCTDCLLIQRVGGRYRFIHRLLQDYFANMKLIAHD
jgi:DNA polymerase III delta prime subunit